jgi:hypothetical protein
MSISVVELFQNKISSNRLKSILIFFKHTGTGTFGRVCIAKCDQSTFYAIKILSILDVIKKKQTQHVKNEKNVLLEIGHPFIISMWVCKWVFWAQPKVEFNQWKVQFVPVSDENRVDFVSCWMLWMLDSQNSW